MHVPGGVATEGKGMGGAGEGRRGARRGERRAHLAGDGEGRGGAPPPRERSRAFLSIREGWRFRGDAL